MNHDPDTGAQNDFDAPERPSKTRVKKAMHELQALGVRLVSLNPGQLESLDLPPDLRDAVREAHRIKGRESLRRHMQYIGRLMRDVDPAPIRARLAIWDGGSLAHAAHERLISQWRQRLIENEGAFTEFAARHPGTDLQRLRSLVRGARTERGTERDGTGSGRDPHNFRELFRFLREAIPEPPVGASNTD